MAEILNNALKELDRRTRILTSYERRMPDPDHRMFVYGLNDEAGILRSSSGSRITEYEDPTFLGFSMEIDSSESPLFQHIPCYLQKYGNHPELRDRSELYNLFVINFFNYIPYRFPLLKKNDSTSPSNLKTILNSTINQAFSSNLYGEDNAKLFVGEENPNDSWIKPDKLSLAVDQFYNPDLAQELRKRIAVKRHYITQFEGLVSGRYNGDTDNELTISVREDVGLHTEMLAYTYENFIWSQRSQRLLIPENICEFTLKINVYEIRNIREFKTALQSANSVLDSIRNFNPKRMEDRINDLVGKKKSGDVLNDIEVRERTQVKNVLDTLERCFSLVRYTLYGCRLDFTKGGSIGNSISNAGIKEVGESSFKVKYRRVHKEYFSNLTPRWTSNGVELFWFDNYRSAVVNPVGKTNRNPISLGSSIASSRIANLKSKAANELQTATKILTNDLRVKVLDDLNIKPIIPSNVYRPGQYLDQFVDQLSSAIGGDIQKQLLRDILY